MLLRNREYVPNLHKGYVCDLGQASSKVGVMVRKQEEEIAISIVLHRRTR